MSLDVLLCFCLLIVKHVYIFLAPWESLVWANLTKETYTCEPAAMSHYKTAALCMPTISRQSCNCRMDASRARVSSSQTYLRSAAGTTQPFGASVICPRTKVIMVRLVCCHLICRKGHFERTQRDLWSYLTRACGIQMTKEKDKYTLLNSSLPDLCV